MKRRKRRNGGFLTLANRRRRRRNPWYVADRWGTVQGGPYLTQDEARALIAVFRRQSKTPEALTRVRGLRRIGAAKAPGNIAHWGFRTHESGKRYSKGRKVAAWARKRKARR